MNVNHNVTNSSLLCQDDDREQEFKITQSQLSRLKYLYGNFPNDYLTGARVLNKWTYQIVWPTRSENEFGRGGLRKSYFYDDKLDGEISSAWNWLFATNLMNVFTKLQTFTVASSAVLTQSLPQPNSSEHTVILGALDHQISVQLPVGTCLNFGIAWPFPESPTSSGSKILPPFTQHHRFLKQGWLINIGGKINCLDWAPNCPYSRQYLLISSIPSFDESHRQHDPANLASLSPAFHPHLSYPSHFQIWSFQGSTDPQHHSQMDYSVSPTLEAVFSFEWGAPRCLKWCPMTTVSPLGDTKDDHIELGFLAGIWTDGCIRVIQVEYSRKSSSHTTVYLKISSCAFESRPPGTVCSTLAWLSPRCIAAGCANGCVAVWDLATCLRNSAHAFQSGESLPPESTVPFFYQPIHTTYITNITSLHPSRPSLIAVSSMSGYNRLVDLSTCHGSWTPFPSQDYVDSPRKRIASMTVAFHDYSQCLLIVDENYLLQALPVLHFQNEILVSRLGSPAACIATSSVHAGALIGCIDGIAAGVDILTRLSTHKKAGGYRGIWFHHEWCEINDHEPGTLSTSIRRRGKSRFTEGYLLEKSAWSAPSSVVTSTGEGGTVVNKNTKGKVRGGKHCDNLETDANNTDTNCKRSRNVGDHDDFVTIWNRYNGIVFSTVYEEESAVTRVAWNPNVNWGTWAAAGMGCGLVRVEDLGLP